MSRISPLLKGGHRRWWWPWPKPKESKPKEWRHEWREQVVAKAQDIRNRLVPVLPCSDDNRNRIQHVTWLLARAEGAASTESFITDWWRGSLQERAWQAIHQARVEIIELLGTDAEVRACAWDVVLKASQTLPSDDPRLNRVSRMLTQPRHHGEHAEAASPKKISRPTVSYLAGAAYREADKQYAQSRSFRNRLIRLITITLFADALVLTAGLMGLFKFNVPGSNDRRVTLMIALFGAIGALLSAVNPLARNQGIRNPFNLPMFQLILKLALGPLFAVVGLAVITTQASTSGVSSLSPLDLLVLATGFGMIQQAATYQVDQPVRGLLAPSPPTEGKVPASHRSDFYDFEDVD